MKGKEWTHKLVHGREPVLLWTTQHVSFLSIFLVGGGARSPMNSKNVNILRVHLGLSNNERDRDLEI